MFTINRSVQHTGGVPMGGAMRRWGAPCLLLISAMICASCNRLPPPDDGGPPLPRTYPWIVVADNGRYLGFEDGTPFVPRGVSMSGDHLNLDYYGDVTIAGQPLSYHDHHIKDLFADMQAHGENFLRIDIEGTSLMPREDIRRFIAEGKIGFVEDPVGSYSSSYAQRIDRVIALAEEYGIYLGFVLITHTCDVTIYTDNLDLYPYHTAQGGPLSTMDDLFTDPDAKEAWKRRLEFISNRWGGSDRIAMWELYNELLGCGGTDPVAAEAWVDEMGQHLRNHELATYGAAHPIIVSTNQLMPEHDFFYESPGTDLMVTHYYHAQQQHLTNPVLLAFDIHEVTIDNLNEIGFRTPFLENERTLAMSYSFEIQRELEHAAAWSFIASGAAGTGATWVRTGSWVAFREKDVVADTHAAMTPILAEIYFATFDSRPLDVVSSNPEIVAMVVADATQALGWVLHDNPDDYFIELIWGWIDNDGSVPLLNGVVLGQWRRIAAEQGAPLDLDPFIEELRDLILQYTNLSPTEAEQLASQVIDNPSSATEAIPDLATHKEELLPVLRDIFTRMRAALIAEEASSGTLTAAYGGHPEVVTELTLTGFHPGSHTVIWFDDTNGNEISRSTISGGELVIATPTFQRHLAFVVH